MAVVPVGTAVVVEAAAVVILLLQVAVSAEVEVVEVVAEAVVTAAAGRVPVIVAQWRSTLARGSSTTPHRLTWS